MREVHRKSVKILHCNSQQYKWSVNKSEKLNEKRNCLEDWNIPSYRSRVVCSILRLRVEMRKLFSFLQANIAKAKADIVEMNVVDNDDETLNIK